MQWLLDRTTYYYQAGFDPNNGSISPGTFLVAHTIRKAIEEGSKHFDFMRGDEPYKRRWKPQHVHRNLRLIASANGLLRVISDPAGTARAVELKAAFGRA